MYIKLKVHAKLLFPLVDIFSSEWVCVFQLEFLFHKFLNAIKQRDVCEALEININRWGVLGVGGRKMLERRDKIQQAL